MQRTASMGIVADKPAGLDDGPVYLWPESVASWNAFLELQTQWRTGMGGPTGLDYTAVLAHLAESVPRKADRRSVYSGVRACERATLAEWARQRAEQRKRDEAKAEADRAARR